MRGRHLPWNEEWVPRSQVDTAIQPEALPAALVVAIRVQPLTCSNESTKFSMLQACSGRRLRAAFEPWVGGWSGARWMVGATCTLDGHSAAEC